MTRKRIKHGSPNDFKDKTEGLRNKHCSKVFDPCSWGRRFKSLGKLHYFFWMKAPDSANIGQ